MSDKRCPTCGCPVKVGGKGTTKCYVPVQTEAEEKLDALMRAVGEVVESRLFKHRFDHASDSVEYALLMNNLSQALAALKGPNHAE